MRKNPTKLERTLAFGQVYFHRHPSCKYGNKCLDKANNERWRGFSCEKCPFFRKYKKFKQQKNEIQVVYMQEVWNKPYIC